MCVSVLGGLGKLVVLGRGANTAIPGTGQVVFPTEVAVCNFSRTSVSMLWPSINIVFHVDNDFRQSLVVKKPSEVGGGRSITPDVRLKS